MTCLLTYGSTKHELKRQRRASESMPSMARTASLDYDTEDEDGTTTTSRHKKAKAEAAQTARQAEQKEKDKERDRARAEAAGRRQERAGRRRADGEFAWRTSILLLMIVRKRQRRVNPDS